MKMKFKEGDRVIIKPDYREYDVHTGTVYQRWPRYSPEDKEPTYNVLMDKPEDRSAFFDESALELDLLRIMAGPPSDKFKVGDKVRVTWDHVEQEKDRFGVITLIANDRADVRGGRNGRFTAELSDLELA